jgi:hypothetical protein
VKRILFLVPLFFLFPGCALLSPPPQYAPATVSHVQKTAAYEDQTLAALSKDLDAASAATTLEAAQAAATLAKNDLKLLHDAESARVAAWLTYEKAKSGAPAAAPAGGNAP